MKSTLALAVLMLPAAVVAQPSPAPHQGPSWDLAKGAPSCEKKKQLLWAEWLCEEVLDAVPTATSS